MDLGEKSEAAIECIFQETIGRWKYYQMRSPKFVSSLDSLMLNLESHICPISSRDLVRNFQSRRGLPSRKKTSPGEIIYESPYSEVSPVISVAVPNKRNENQTNVDFRE